MTNNGVYTTYGTALAGSFQTNSAPPSTRQLVDSVFNRPSAEFQTNFAASKFTPDPSKTVDILV